jgi:hypothetical protein
MQRKPTKTEHSPTKNVRATFDHVDNEVDEVDDYIDTDNNQYNGEYEYDEQKKFIRNPVSEAYANPAHVRRHSKAQLARPIWKYIKYALAFVAIVATFLEWLGKKMQKNIIRPTYLLVNLEGALSPIAKTIGYYLAKTTDILSLIKRVITFLINDILNLIERVITELCKYLGPLLREIVDAAADILRALFALLYKPAVSFFEGYWQYIKSAYNEMTLSTMTLMVIICISVIVVLAVLYLVIRCYRGRATKKGAPN